MEENKGDPSQVIGTVRDVLLEHMQEGLDHYRVQSAVLIGKWSGRLMSEEQVASGDDVPHGLRLTMRSGAEYDLILRFAEEGEPKDDPPPEIA